MRCLLSQGAELGDLALFIWAVDIAWRKSRGMWGWYLPLPAVAQHSSNSGIVFYLLITIISVRENSTRLQLAAPRGQQAAHPRASHGTKIPVVKRNTSSILRGMRCCIPRISCCRHGWLCSSRSLGWTQWLLQLFSWLGEDIEGAQSDTRHLRLITSEMGAR